MFGGMLLIGRLGGFSRRRAAGDDGAVVVFGFPGLGDLVRCHSLVRMVAAQFPQRPIDLVARRPAVEIAAFMPEIRAAIGEDFRHNCLTLMARWALAQNVRARGYRTAYLVQSSFKSALVPFLAGIPERIGWSEEGRLALLTRPRFHMRRLPRMVDRTCWLGLHCNEEAPPRWPEPRLRVPVSLAAQFDALVRKARAMAPVVAIAPGSAHTYKNWPVENYATLARHCVQVGCTVWIVGSSGHDALAEAIAKAAPVHDHLADTVTKLALSIAAADIFVGNDSGPLHIAGAFSKPSIGIFGHHEIASKAPINASVKKVVPELRHVQKSVYDVHWPSVDRVIHRFNRVLDSTRVADRLSSASMLLSAVSPGATEPHSAVEPSHGLRTPC